MFTIYIMITYYLHRINLLNITSALLTGHKATVKHKELVIQDTCATMMGLVLYVHLWELQIHSHIVAVLH